MTSKVAPLSVRRNRARRLLYEAYRLTEQLLKKGYDIVLLAKKDISGQSLFNIKYKLNKLYKKSNIIK